MPLLFIALLFVACEDTETNSSAVQANIDSTFFKALGSYAIMDADDFSITIIGMSGNQELTLHTEWRGQHAYSVGPDSESYASFTDVDGNVFTTENEGSSGEIVITKSVYVHLKENLEVMPLPPQYIKGKSEPVETFRLLGIRENHHA